MMILRNLNFEVRILDTFTFKVRNLVFFDFVALILDFEVKTVVESEFVYLEIFKIRFLSSHS